MKAIAKAEQKDNKKNSNRGIRIVTAEEYEGLEVNGKVELIKALIPLGLMHAADELQKEVTRLAGEWYEREKGGKLCVRYGSNPSSIRVGGQKVPFVVPRVRNLRTNQEVSLETLRELREGGEIDELLLRRVL